MVNLFSRSIRIRVWVFLAFLLAIGKPLVAQQNLFNVPSGTVTAAEEVFIQEQINFGVYGESNLTIDYGLGENWEAGLNIFKVNLYPGNRTPQPGESNDDAVMFNLQKVWQPADNLNVELGSQNGLSANNFDEKIDYLNFTWLVGRWELPSKRLTAVGGMYYGNEAFLGHGNNLGFMVGVEIPIIPDKFDIVADYISGDNSQSVAVIGGQYTISERIGWQLSLGAQLPSPGSDNGYGAVLELTKYPKKSPRPAMLGTGNRPLF